jgi:serine/threonine-protein kinase RsbW
MKKITVPAKPEQLEIVANFVSKELELLDCPAKAQMQISIAVEEIFVNIANYAYHPSDGNATILLEIKEDPLRLIVTFMDQGVPYNPLDNPDPDITLSADERQIGGLGIFMVKKSMDAVEYKYENNQNIFTIIKNLT